jgi:hypothetical protein
MRGLFFCPERLWDAVRGFASLKLLALGRKPATKRTYQQHAPFRTEGFIQACIASTLYRVDPFSDQAEGQEH